MEYNFDNLFVNATMLNRNFLKNYFGYELPIEEDEIIFRNYYQDIMNYIYENDIYRPSTADVEKLLNNDEKKYCFLIAQAHQLKYDIANGRNAMVRGQDKELDVSRDTINYLRKVGLLRTIRTKGC